MNIQQIIKTLDLIPLPGEGGYYRESYRAVGKTGDRNYSTAIYYLITPLEFSALHHIPHDELFHFYLGDPVEMIQIDPQGKLKKMILGPEILKGQQLQITIPGESWQGARVIEGGSWALLGTTVAPGFEFRDFKRGERAVLLNQYPAYKNEILRFTKGD
jgi:predicted cupin superfamily sugar epimerase